MQPVATSQLSSVQGLLSLQSRASPPWQTDSEQKSSTVHSLPSSQDWAFGEKSQPSSGMHESSVHGLESLQTTVEPGEHSPSLHMSETVQEFPSWQGPELLL
jgi:hypothetical protein